jgi:hypothetical protein
VHALWQPKSGTDVSVDAIVFIAKHDYTHFLDNKVEVPNILF